ncbi:MAG: FHA domain-containing protein [Ruminococcaceae bacterium]|nr:FHA domain-containing protein [Oscillospiraceae bacterium]
MSDSRHCITGLWQTVTDWLLEGADRNFWGSRLFWVCGIALALLALITFIICKRASARRERLRTAAVDRLRDDALTRAIVNGGGAEEKDPGAFLLSGRKSVRRRFLRLIEQAELSHRELVFSTEKEITIGRIDSCDVPMRDRHAANLHAVILCRDGIMYIRTDQAELPLYLRHGRNVMRMQPYNPYRLRNKDTFQIGNSQFEVRLFSCRIPGGYL